MYVPTVSYSNNNSMYVLTIENVPTYKIGTNICVLIMLFGILLLLLP